MNTKEAARLPDPAEAEVVGMNSPMWKVISQVVDLQYDLLGPGEGNDDSIVTTWLSKDQPRLLSIGKRISDTKESFDNLEYNLWSDHPAHMTIRDVKSALLDLFMMYERSVRMAWK